MDLIKLVQVTGWLVAILGGLIAAFKAIHETTEGRRLRASELRWKKAQLAREILESLRTRRFRDATLMLDWTGRDYGSGSNERVTVFWEDLPGALRVWNKEDPISFNEKEVYVRDCFDDLFDAMNSLEHYLQTGLLDFADVQFPMEYHVDNLRYHWNAVEKYISHYGNKLASQFIQRFPISLTHVQPRQCGEARAQQIGYESRSQAQRSPVPPKS
jgi:hypothetical protein